MKFIYYDPDTKTGYTFGKNDIGAIMDGFFPWAGIFGKILIFSCLVALILTFPFLATAFLDDFVNEFVANNALIFIVLGILVVFLKLSSKQSGRFWVRLLFDLYVIASVLYLFLYILHFDVPTYSLLRISHNYFPDSSLGSWMELVGIEKVTAATSGNWFYEFFITATDKVLDYITFLGNHLVELDSSSLNSSFSKIDLLEILKILGQYISFGGGIALLVLLSLVVALVVAVVSISFPYIMTLVTLVFLNKILYRVRTFIRKG